MAITAALVKELRDRTGSGMMECKKALQESNGDIDAAIELMRKSGLAKADKKAGRTAAEGVIAQCAADDGKSVSMVEVNCETDFVSKGADFQQFAADVARQVLDGNPDDLESLLGMAFASGKSADEERRELIARIGENIHIRRFVRLETATGNVNRYLHGNRIGVVVELQGGDADLAKDIAMHVAASAPLCVRPDDVPDDILARERSIFEAQAAESGKPAEIVTKMVEGRIRKYLNEATLLGQPFVKVPEQTVDALLQTKDAKVIQFVRFELGEGIEKKVESFADEVMAQVRSS